MNYRALADMNDTILHNLHRMPQDMIAWGAAASERGLQVVIAGAGGAAHLPGMLASVTPLPVCEDQRAGSEGMRASRKTAVSSQPSTAWHATPIARTG